MPRVKRAASPPAAGLPAPGPRQRDLTGAVAGRKPKPVAELPPLPGPLATHVDSAAVQAVAAEVRSCTRCPLHVGRINAVPGEGTGAARIVLVGEAPGRNEDETGRPFVGSAGKNLDLALREAGLARADCFITSINKCRPPDNRDPTPAEKAACRPYLDVQVRALRPAVLVALGRHGLSGLLDDPPVDFASLRGSFLPGPQGVPVFVSLHPAAVIYRQKWKEQYLQDWRDFGAWLRGSAPPGFGRGTAPPSPSR